MTNNYEKPDWLEVSDAYFRDAQDFCVRLQVTYFNDNTNFRHLKSRRFKSFIDLRMGLEAALKSAFAYGTGPSKGGKDLIDSVKAFSHKLKPLSEQITDPLGPQIRALDGHNAIAACDALPIALRYEIESADFRTGREDAYYETIGSETWMRTAFELTQEITNLMGATLSKHSEVVALNDLKEEIPTERRGYSHDE